MPIRRQTGERTKENRRSLTFNIPYLTVQVENVQGALFLPSFGNFEELEIQNRSNGCSSIESLKQRMLINLSSTCLPICALSLLSSLAFGWLVCLGSQLTDRERKGEKKAADGKVQVSQVGWQVALLEKKGKKSDNSLPVCVCVATGPTHTLSTLGTWAPLILFLSFSLSRSRSLFN